MRINPNADPKVKIPVRSGYFVTVAALQDAEAFPAIAHGVDLTPEQLEEDIRRWAIGAGLPYGVLANDQ